MGLNENQRRAVSITLRLFEERLDEIESLLDRSDERILRRRRPPDLDPDERERADALIDEMRRTLAELARTFGFVRQTVDSRQTIAGIAGMTWENLGEITSRRLGAYGEVDDDVRVDLDPVVETLMRDLLALQAVLVAPSDPTESLRSRRTHPIREDAGKRE